MIEFISGIVFLKMNDQELKHSELSETASSLIKKYSHSLHLPMEASFYNAMEEKGFEEPRSLVSIEYYEDKENINCLLKFEYSRDKVEDMNFKDALHYANNVACEAVTKYAADIIDVLVTEIKEEFKMEKFYKMP